MARGLGDQRGMFIQIGAPRGSDPERARLVAELAENIAREILAAADRVPGHDARKVAREVARLRMIEVARGLAAEVRRAVGRLDRLGDRGTIARAVAELPRGHDV